MPFLARRWNFELFKHTERAETLFSSRRAAPRFGSKRSVQKSDLLCRFLFYKSRRIRKCIVMMFTADPWNNSACCGDVSAPPWTPSSARTHQKEPPGADTPLRLKRQWVTLLRQHASGRLAHASNSQHCFNETTLRRAAFLMLDLFKTMQIRRFSLCFLSSWFAFLPKRGYEILKLKTCKI